MSSFLLIFRVNSEGPGGSLLSCVSSFTSYYREWKETIPTTAGPKVIAASVRGETESESSLWTLMERLNNQAITVCCRDFASINVHLFPPMLFPVTAERGILIIRDTSQCPKLSCLFSLIFNWGLFHFNFLYWFITWHINGNGAGLWHTVSL